MEKIRLRKIIRRVIVGSSLMPNIDIVIATTCHLTDKFKRCRDSVEATIPEGVKVHIALDRRKRGKAESLNAIMVGQPGDFIYLHDDMECCEKGWYKKFAAAASDPSVGMLRPSIHCGGSHGHPGLGGYFFRKAAVEKVGILNLDVRNWEAEYLQRIQDAGFKIGWVPALFNHKMGAK